MTIRKVGNLFIVLGLLTFVLEFILPVWIYNFVPLPWLTSGLLMILGGVALRVFSPIPDATSGQLAGTTSISIKKEFGFWRNLLFASLILWPLSYFGVIFGLRGGTSPYGNPAGELWIPTFDALFIAGLIGSVVCLVLAHFYKIRKEKLAIQMLRLPFLYLVFMVGIYTYIQLSCRCLGS